MKRTTSTRDGVRTKTTAGATSMNVVRPSIRLSVCLSAGQSWSQRRSSATNPRISADLPPTDMHYSFALRHRSDQPTSTEGGKGLVFLPAVHHGLIATSYVQLFARNCIVKCGGSEADENAVPRCWSNRRRGFVAAWSLSVIWHTCRRRRDVRSTA